MRTKKQIQSIKPILIMIMMIIIDMQASAQLMPGRLYGKATVGGNITLMNGNFAVMTEGELFLGSHAPSGLQTNALNIIGNYEGETGAKVYHSITDNSNAIGTKGFIDIRGTATGITNIMLDMATQWDGSQIDLVKAYLAGSDTAAFRMNETNYNGHIAMLLHRREGNSLIWYIAERSDIFDDCLDLIYQKLNNTLVVNNNPRTNGGYQFGYYTWYKDNTKINENSHDHLGGHYYTGGGNLDINAVYYAEVITTAGERFKTCPFTPTIQTKQVSVGVYPNPTTVAEHQVTVKVETDNDEALRMAILDVYSSAGQWLGRIEVRGRREIPVNLPPVAGVYVLQFKSEIIDKNMKIIVE